MADPNAPTVQMDVLSAYHSIEAAHAGLGNLVNLAVLSGIPWQTILAFVIRHGVPKLIEWLQKLVDEQSGGVPEA